MLTVSSQKENDAWLEASSQASHTLSGGELCSQPGYGLSPDMLGQYQRPWIQPARARREEVDYQERQSKKSENQKEKRAGSWAKYTQREGEKEGF